MRKAKPRQQLDDSLSGPVIFFLQFCVIQPTFSQAAAAGQGSRRHNLEPVNFIILLFGPGADTPSPRI